MEQQSIDKILDKVKKLLSLADISKNNSDAEAKSAMLKAQKLLAEYNLSMDDVDESAIQDEIVTESCEHKWNSGFRIPLGMVLADNFRCSVFLRGNTVTFVGYKTDANICRQTFEFAYKYITRRGNQEYEEARKWERQTKGVFNSYAEGFILGLRESLAKQCTALMIVTPPEVKEELKRITEGGGTRRVKHERNLNTRVFDKGIREGKQFLETRQIEG